MSEEFDLEEVAFKIKVLHGMIDDVIADADVESWREANDRLYVLLDAMGQLVNGLYEYASNGKLEGR